MFIFPTRTKFIKNLLLMPTPSMLSKSVGTLLGGIPQGVVNNSVPDLSNMSYQDLLKANPYRNIEYRESPWQGLLKWLGFRTNADAYKESLALQAKEYDAEVMNKAYNEQYESPLAEASRMRAAGLNPDLLGLGDVAGAAAPDIGDENPPVSPTSDAESLQPVYQFATMCMSAVSTGMALAKDYAGLVNMGIVNDAGEIQNVKSVTDLADYVAKQFVVSPEHWNNRDMFVMDAETGEEIPYRLSLAEDRIGTYMNSIPAKFQKLFKKNLATSMFSLSTENEMYKKGIDWLKNKKDYAFLRSGPEFEQGLADEAVMAVVGPLAHLAFEVDKTELQFKKFKSQYDRDLYDPAGREAGTSLDPALSAGAQNTKYQYDKDYYFAKDAVAAADAENASNALSSARMQFEYQCDSAWRKIVGRLYNLAENGNRWASSMLLSFTLQKMTSQAGTSSLIGNVLSQVL